MSETKAATPATQAIAARSTELSFSIRADMSLQDVAQAFALSGLFKDLQEARNEQDALLAQRQAMVKILAGREMSMEPVESMMGLQIVEGRIGLTAETMAARIKANPDYRYKVKALTRQECTLVFLERFEGKWEEMGESSYTIWDGEAAGLCKVDGEGSAAKPGRRSSSGKVLPWEAHTRNLLYSRAMSNGFRLFTPHLKLPRVYTPEEIEEIASGESSRAADAPAAPTASAGAAGLDDVLDAEFSEPDAEVVEEDPTPEPSGDLPPPASSSAPPQTEPSPEASKPLSEPDANPPGAPTSDTPSDGPKAEPDPDPTPEPSAETLPTPESDGSETPTPPSSPTPNGDTAEGGPSSEDPPPPADPGPQGDAAPYLDLPSQFLLLWRKPRRHRVPADPHIHIDAVPLRRPADVPAATGDPLGIGHAGTVRDCALVMPVGVHRLPALPHAVD